MNRRDALDLLPGAYARAIALYEAGADEDGIALAVGVEPESVAPLLEVARRKLADLLASAIPLDPWQPGRTPSR